ncbi:hypothetical protein QMK33_18930 [Hymenobacter sp. H14-R3]|uniref:hypothetical protein n=1 Tax=Hymenobacter sp. H14-R3 TaxID=3046308 RepID=UPI0024BB0208|nr:hypothetical protein [Hymenobacter sp. H14-R3]MDJ0367228.1 hypothetical protein [Hymenobacter sp. H14-R3]
MQAITYEGILDTSAYAAYLHRIAGLLPPNAYAFASDSEHYNFYGQYCTHDLKLNRIEITNGSTALSHTVFLDKSEFKHEKNLRIDYYGVVSFQLNRLPPDVEHAVDGLLIDEISVEATTNRVVHEIQFWGAELRILCCDLVAQWL